MTEELKCEICEEIRNLRKCGIIVGVALDSKEAIIVCEECLTMWYENGITDINELKEKVEDDRKFMEFLNNRR